jgi:hypothetical protein
MGFSLAEHWTVNKVPRAGIGMISCLPQMVEKKEVR